MPTAMGKITIFFESSNYGWTEGFNSTSTDQTTNILKAQQYVTARRQLLGKGAFITEIRASTIGPALRTSQVMFIDPANGGSSIFTNKSQTADDPSLSLLVRYTLASGKRSLKHLSGIPDYLFDRSLPDFFDFTNPLWVAAFTAYQTYIRTAGLAIRVKSGSDFLADGIIAVQRERVRRKNRGRPFLLPVGRRI